MGFLSLVISIELIEASVSIIWLVLNSLLNLLGES